MNKAVDLTQNDIFELKKILNAHLTNEKVMLFGSRVNGNSHLHSDLDIAIISNEKLTWQMISDIRESFENASFSFRIDFLDYHRISNAFQTIINQTGIRFDYHN